MAETNFGRLDPNQPLVQPVVRHVGEGWTAYPDKNDLADTINNLPFANPAGLAPAPTTPRPPEPTERGFANAWHRTSRHAMLPRRSRPKPPPRGSGRRSTPRWSSVTSPASTAWKTRSRLTSSSSCARRALPSQRPNTKNVGCGANDCDLIAAERAEATLQAEHDAAASAAAARRAVTIAGIDVLGLKAIEGVGRYHKALALAESERRNLSAFDQLASRLKAPEPPAVTAALYGLDFRLLDTSAWQRALDSVLADPEAPIPDITPTTEPPVIAISTPPTHIPEEERLRILAERNAERRARGDFSTPPPPDVRVMQPIR